VAKLNRKVC